LDLKNKINLYYNFININILIEKNKGKKLIKIKKKKTHLNYMDKKKSKKIKIS